MNSVLLDASESHDALGSKQLSFHWEEVQGPVDSTLTSDSNLLQLHNLKEGKYKFRSVRAPTHTHLLSCGFTECP